MRRRRRPRRRLHADEVARRRARRSASYPSAALADTITVVTSFPKELTAGLQGGLREEVSERQGRDPQQGHRRRASPSCASSRPAAAPRSSGPRRPTRSRCWPRRSCCEKVGRANKGIPAKIGNYPINDPEGCYRGQALAGYGLMWNTRYLQAQQAAGAEGVGRPDEAGLLRPRRDLGAVALGHDAPDLRDHPAGRRLGQGLEPDPADRRQLRRGHRAQLRRARRRQNGQFGIGLVIDFFGLAGKDSGFPVEFVYPSVTAIVPANIALVAGAKNPRRRASLHAVHAVGGRPAAAARSEDLAPAGAADRRYAKAPAGYPNPFSGIDPSAQGELRRRPVGDRATTSCSRCSTRSITFRLKELQAATKAIHDAERAREKRNPQAGADQAGARLAFATVGEEARRTGSSCSCSRRTSKKPRSRSRSTGLEDSWNAADDARRLRARQGADRGGSGASTA